MIKILFTKTKEKIIEIYKAIIGFILRLFSEDDYYIVQMDGGICSQMDQYLLGEFLSDKGYKVMYDCSFYDENPMDILGEQVRNYDIEKLFPDIVVNKVDKKTVTRYRNFYFNFNVWNVPCKDYTALRTPPLYLGGYGYEFVDDRRERFPRVFTVDIDKINLSYDNKILLDKVSEDDGAIGMHIRRGDLADGITSREGVTKEYFVGAVSIALDRSSTHNVYIFSDGMEWVKKELIYLLPSDGNYIPVDINGADNGWCDLLLMSKCRHMIASQGTMGYHAKLLANDRDCMLVVPDIKFAHSLVEINGFANEEVCYC